ncbi:MAG: alternate-type signal peptide domain-containing protein, partial [Nocardioidaceae bacterium]
MNKMIKGSVAGATGIALLMGGFGTYALWNDSHALTGTVSSGVLGLSLGTAAWTDAATDGVDHNTPWDVTPDSNGGGVDLMVPGDTVQLSQPFHVDAKGRNLQFDVTVNGLTSAAWKNLGVTMKLDKETSSVNSIDSRHFTVTTNGNGDHTLTVLFNFPEGVGDGQYSGNDET